MPSDTAILGKANATAAPSLGSVAPAAVATMVAAGAAGWAMGSHLAWSLGLGALAAIGSATAFALKGARRFGWSNGVTMIRLGLAAALLAPVAGGGKVEASWSLVLLAWSLLGLDGFDGWLARRRNEASPFGARFDMEADTVMLGVLAVLALAAGRAPAAILMAGCLRPLFVAAGRIWPWLAAPLPPSTRRKLFCVLPTALLATTLAPPIGSRGGTVLAVLALALLLVSFALDVMWLAARRTGPRS